MSVPEYVFLHRIQEFYDQLRAGRNLWKIDEVLNFVDERGRNMIKKWIQDPRFPWTLGRGYTLLTQPAPVISLVVDSDSDRPGGNFIGQYADEGIRYDDDGNPKEYWLQNAKLKHGSFLFVFTAPNADILTAMYCLTERAMYEGEVPPINEENIITFSDYGINELVYRGSDLRPDQNYVPTATFARTLNVTCSYMHTWTGRIFGKNNYLFSLNIGNIYEKQDDIYIQENPAPSYLSSAQPENIEKPITPIFMTSPGIILQGKTTIGGIPVYLTTNGMQPSADNIIRIPDDTTLSFEITITAFSATSDTAMWKISGVVSRTTGPSTVALHDLTKPLVIGDDIFRESYVDIYADTVNGALMVSAAGVNGLTVTWNATIEIR